MRLLALCFAVTVALGASPLLHAECSASSGTKRTHLVELYTSEGCSSCPPADRWLNALPTDTRLVPLAFHVDYWDSLGWVDRFADHRYSERQRALATQWGSTMVYTPQVSLDGRPWKNWGSGLPPTTQLPQPVALALHVDASNPLQLRLEASVADGTPVPDYVAYFALSEDKLSSVVKAGENRGAELRHNHVVRALVGPLKLAAATASLELPETVSREHTRVVAFVQRADGGEIANVVQVALASCPADGAG